MKIKTISKLDINGDDSMANIQITTSGIKKSLQKYKPLKVLSEYIWNGFDAGATCIEILCKQNEVGGLVDIQIRDNGYGIPKNDLKVKFTPFFESQKVFEPNKKKHSATHGKNGVGRLTFFKISNIARWTTIYEEKDKRYKYDISIASDSLEKYNDNEIMETDENTGTVVEFKNVFGLQSIEQIKEFIILEFCWFLELNLSKGYSIKINEENLDYSKNIMDKETNIINYNENNIEFKVKYIQWKNKLDEEYSCYYYINTKNNEIFKETTSLNNKGDKFYHSVFIKSSIFDEFIIDDKIEQQTLIGYNKSSNEYKFLIESVNNLLRKKRKPFLKKYTDKLIDELETSKAFPNYDEKNLFEKFKRDELENTIREIYKIQPKIFVGLNIEQKKTLVRFLDLIMQSGESHNLIKILNEIIELDAEEREELAGLLDTTKMTNIIRTIKLIKDRYKAMEELKELVFNKELQANEVNHLQKFIEKHYWIFGEQYHLVTAAEPDFEEALRRYQYVLTGENKKVEINHIDKNKEMDIFAVRQNISSEGFSNIVVELKHPDIRLGEKELSQIKKYMNVILKEPRFNADNVQWEFYLVGNKFSTTNYIQYELKNNIMHGEKSLVFKVDKYKIYVKTWSEILAEFEMKHKYLNEKLEIEKCKLANKKSTVNEIIQDNSNTAIQPKEISIS